MRAYPAAIPLSAASPLSEVPEVQEYEQAHEAGAQVLVTGECKHSDAIAASVLNLNIIAAGHYQTENPMLIPLAAYLRSNTEGVEYMISKVNTPTFRTYGRCAE